MENKKKAILAVSFGTSFHETREKTIDRIEADLAAAYPEYTLYRAWTSKMIITKLKKRDGIVIPTVAEAVEQMISDGVQELIVQPTHIINGIENDLMKEDVLARKEAFEKIAFGDPLLTTTEDNVAVLQAVMSEFPALAEDEALVFMGHGTTHYANTVYAALDYTFKDLGYTQNLSGNGGGLSFHGIPEKAAAGAGTEEGHSGTFYGGGRRSREQRYVRRGRGLLEEPV